MLPSTIAAWVLAVATLVAVGAMLVALIRIVGLRLEGRPRPPGPALVVAGAGGFILGLGILLSETVPQIRLGLVLLTVVLGLLGLTAGRADLTGLWLVGASIPWLVLGTAVLLDDAWFGVRANLGRVLPSMVVGSIALLVGVILLENRRRLRSRFEHDVADGRPLKLGEERRWNTASISTGDRRWLGLPPNELASSLAILVGAIVTVAAAHGQTPVVTVAFGLIGVVGRPAPRPWPWHTCGRLGPAARSRQLRGWASGSWRGSRP